MRILSTFYPSEEKYTIIDSYEIYDEEASGVENISVAGITITPGVESIVLNSPAATKVSIFATNGTLVCSKNVAEGETMIRIPAGIYVVHASGITQKIVVK